MRDAFGYQIHALRRLPPGPPITAPQSTFLQRALRALIWILKGR